MIPYVLLTMLMLQPFGLVASAQAPSEPGGNWPRTYTSNGNTFSLYQPQVDTWQDNVLSAFSAVGVQPAGSNDKTYGVIYFTARTEVDKINRVVTLEEFAITKANFPTAPSWNTQAMAALQAAIPASPVFYPLDRLESGLAVSGGANGVPAFAVDNTPPQIIVSPTAAVLVLIDGAPVLRPVANSSLQRVINTKALVLFDPSNSQYSLSIMDGWLWASSINGPWTYTGKSPKDGDKIAASLEQSKVVAPLDSTDSSGNTRSLKDAAKSSTIPTVHVSTSTAELIIMQGQPQLAPIPGTTLLYATNTQSQVFFETASQQYYVLISGRWFASSAITGPWEFTAANSLPADFAKIPTDHAKAGVLVSVAGTPQAEEGVIANSIPQTATITRSAATLSVSYDGGSPKFVPLTGTTMQYAQNSAIPVIATDSASFYAVQNGVWFMSGQAAGPWTIATSVPASIYSIPPSSPLFYVTYVKIYGSTPQVVYAGYTPGYYGTVVSTDGVVVYGTGYTYPAYISDTVWVGYPASYGVGAGFTWSVAAGWAMGFGIGLACACAYPWWGPIGYGWGGAYTWGTSYGWGAWGGAAATNVYGRWGNTAYAGTRAAWANPYTGNVGAARGGSYYNSATGARGAGVGGANYNAYTGNYAAGQAGAKYDPSTGVVSGGARGVYGNAYTGQAAGGQGAFRYNTNTGSGVAEKDGNVYATKDGNVYQHNDGGGWSQHTGSGWQSVNGDSLGGGGGGGDRFGGGGAAGGGGGQFGGGGLSGRFGGGGGGLNGQSFGRGLGGMRSGGFGGAGGFGGGGGFRGGGGRR